MSTDTPSVAGVRTTCPYCGVGCGVIATPAADGSVRIAGDRDHPANFGKLCSKGSALAETLGEDERVLYPEIGGQRVSWDDALDAVAEGFQGIVDTYGPDSVAFYLSGQLLTEDYYVANKLMKGFLGSANVDTNSRLCMASSVAGHKRAFGSDTVPGSYEDLDEAELIVLVGSNAAWCHPILYRRMLAAKEKRGTRIVVIDPRRTASCDSADLHLALAPGTDTVLFNGLFAYLAAHGTLDRRFIERHCSGFDAALAAAQSDVGSMDDVAARTGLRPRDIETFYSWFAATEKTVSCYSQGVNQSSSGTDKVNAIINCHLATGRIGWTGTGPFSLTGQPNAMGGREVGGLANQLAAHMGFDEASVERVRRFWQAPRIATGEGLKAVDMFEAMNDGRIKAVWIMATNPAASLPDAQVANAALEHCELVVVSECFAGTDTLRHADIVLPAAAWGEKDGTVTNSERRISRQRPFQPSPGEARPDWWMVTEVARRLGFGRAFAFQSAADVFREHAALSAFENEGARAFDIGGLAELNDDAFDALAPVQWPVRRLAGDGAGTERMFTSGGFTTADGRARFIAVTARPAFAEAGSLYPLVLNTGRVRDQWHTMTRTGRSPTLTQHASEPILLLNPKDAVQYGIDEGGYVAVKSPWGRAEFKVEISAAQRPGSVFAPIHWSEATASRSGAGPLVNPACDPISGQPALKHTPVSIRPIYHRYRGFLLSRRKLTLPQTFLWSVARDRACWIYSIATDGPMNGNWPLWVRGILNCEPDQLMAFVDARAGRRRYARLVDNQLEACLILDHGDSSSILHTLKAAFTTGPLESLSRRMLLAGHSIDGITDPGRMVCACHAVGLNQIVEAIGRDSLRTVEEIGLCLKAGTNCGSCQPELRDILKKTKALQAAAE